MYFIEKFVSPLKQLSTMFVDLFKQNLQLIWKSLPDHLKIPSYVSKNVF